MKTLLDDPQKLNHLFHVTIEQAVEGIFWIDKAGQILFANDAACRLLGYTRKELLGLTIPDIDLEKTSGAKGFAPLVRFRNSQPKSAVLIFSRVQGSKWLAPFHIFSPKRP